MNKSEAGPSRLKAPLSLIPFKALAEVAHAFAEGLHKYGRNDWRKGGSWAFYTDKILRHAGEFADGADIDSDSGRSPIAHVCADALILLFYIVTDRGTDDRNPDGD